MNSTDIEQANTPIIVSTFSKVKMQMIFFKSKEAGLGEPTSLGEGIFVTYGV